MGGATGKPLKNFVCIGIGGSQLGPEFVNEALRADAAAATVAHGRTLRFLANVDPVDYELCTRDLDPEETLIVVISKTFTTAETMLNARTAKKWILEGLAAKGVTDEAKVAGSHIIAVSTAISKCVDFGINEDNIFGFWSWVGGRFSVCSAVGIVPYSQALKRFPAHIQQVDMESNGKRVAMDGKALPFPSGEIDFGEPGTNGQHSFYQLMHQGRVVPADFIGFCESQSPVDLPEEAVGNHDELMSNFFAQPDALAYGKTLQDLEQEGIPESLRQHKVFAGNRPSSSMLMTRLDAFAVRQLLAIYEHRTAVQGFIWGLNSFD